MTNYSPVTKSNLNRQSVKLFNLEEESVKSSRIYNEVELKTILLKYSVEIKNNELKKRNSYIRFDLDKYYEKQILHLYLFCFLIYFFMIVSIYFSILLLLIMNAIILTKIIINNILFNIQ